jgi:CBS domain-containing protein
MPTVSDIIRVKGRDVFMIDSEATVLETVQMMNEHRVGAALVTSGGEVLGIFTERDVLSRVVGQQRDPAGTRVRQVMTANLIYCDAMTDLDEIAQIMQARRIRHLPVRGEDERLMGMISIGDVNAYHVMQKQATIENLTDYICGRS